MNAIADGEPRYLGRPADRCAEVRGKCVSGVRTMRGAPHEEKERPCAAHGLVSYRCRGRYDWIWIGAIDHVDAMKQARRSCNVAQESDLQIWNGFRYVYVYAEGHQNTGLASTGTQCTDSGEKP